MLGMVVTVFIFCWTPILIFEVLQSYDIIGTQVFGSIKHTKTCFSLLAYFNRSEMLQSFQLKPRKSGLLQLYQSSDIRVYVEKLQTELY